MTNPWYKPHYTLKGRLTIGALCALAITGLLFGITLSQITKHDGQQAVDADLRQRVDGILDRNNRANFLPDDREPPGPPEPPEHDAGDTRLLTGSGTFVQIVDQRGVVLQQRGDLPNQLPPVTKSNGFATVTIHGEQWRILTVELSPINKLRVRMATSLEAVNEQVDRIRYLIVLLGTGGLLFTAFAVWILASIAIRPLEKLREGAAKVSTTEDLQTRLPAQTGPFETQALAASLNAMLARLESSTQELQRALQATRRFAADAGHELRTPLTSLRANLDTLMRNPTLSETEQTTLMEDMSAEQDRIVKVLSGLQALARGEAADALPKEDVDLGDLLDTAIVGARRRHPHVTYAFTEQKNDQPIVFSGWQDGLRLLFDNLLDNAALHGKQADSKVHITLQEAPDIITIIVEDNGKGIPESERDELLKPFCRGSETTAQGTGLGLAIVAQQVALHHGKLHLSQSDLGGLKVEIQL